MCLYRIRKIPKKVPKFGYVCMREHMSTSGDRLWPSIFSSMMPRSGGYLPGRWYKACTPRSKENGLIYSRGKTYKCGFHVWQTLDAAILYCASTERIWECEIEDVVAYGDNEADCDFYLRCFVVSKRKLVAKSLLTWSEILDKSREIKNRYYSRRRDRKCA